VPYYKKENNEADDEEEVVSSCELVRNDEEVVDKMEVFEEVRCESKDAELEVFEEVVPQPAPPILTVPLAQPVPQQPVRVVLGEVFDVDEYNTETPPKPAENKPSTNTSNTCQIT
jgi:hypothetical protein